MEVLSFAAGPPHCMLWTWSSIFVPPAKYVVSVAAVSSTNALAGTGPLIGSGVTSWLPVAPNKLVQSYGCVVAALCTTLPSNSNIPLSWTASAAVTPHNMPATTSKPVIAMRALPNRPRRKFLHALICSRSPFRSRAGRSTLLAQPDDTPEVVVEPARSRGDLPTSSRSHDFGPGVHRHEPGRFGPPRAPV